MLTLKREGNKLTMTYEIDKEGVKRLAENYSSGELTDADIEKVMAAIVSESDFGDEESAVDEQLVSIIHDVVTNEIEDDEDLDDEEGEE